MSAVPDPQDRGAFMGLNSSIQQLAGGLAASLAGLIVVEEDSGKLSHYPILGYVVTLAMVITLIMMFIINRMVNADKKNSLQCLQTIRNSRNKQDIFIFTKTFGA